LGEVNAFEFPDVVVGFGGRRTQVFTSSKNPALTSYLFAFPNHKQEQDWLPRDLTRGDKSTCGSSMQGENLGAAC
jgi:hypothetical protein